MFDETTASLEAEAIAATNAAPIDADVAPGPGSPAAAVPAEASEEEVVAGYTLICGELVDLGANAIVPAWKVNRIESGKLAGAMARALVLWFPDMIIPPKYLALLTVAGVCFEIAQARRDPSTGRFLPAHLPQKSNAGETSQTAAH
jgi:hypothetical protein